MGRYIVADPDICHDKPTFRGARILVADALEQVAAGLAWETIIEEWRGSITHEAIAEAVRVAKTEVAPFVRRLFGVIHGKRDRARCQLASEYLFIPKDPLRNKLDDC